MAMTCTYTTINGMLMMENRGGVETAYVTDTQGSLIQCRDSSGTKTYEAFYWPYGEIRSETGTNPSKWGYIGLLGYMKDAANLLYVRARYFKPNLTQWLTVDPLWPDDSAYGYCAALPTSLVDPSGFSFRNCNPLEESACKALCKGESQIMQSCTAEDSVTYAGHLCIIRITTTCTCINKSGDCSPKHHRFLQNAVDAACKGLLAPRTCTGGMSCSDIKSNLARFAACAAARSKINNECFRGGNKGHEEARQNAIRGWENCLDKYRNHIPPC